MMNMGANTVHTLPGQNVGLVYSYVCDQAQAHFCTLHVGQPIYFNGLPYMRETQKRSP